MASIAETPKVSVIIINWNRLDDVLASIRILSRRSRLHTEIIVVDNGSSDGSAEVLAEIQAIRLITLEENLGPAKARNLAIEAARGRYLFFLDSDAMITSWALARLVDRMDQDSSIGVIGCRIVNYSTRQIDQWIYADREQTHSLREFETYSFSAAGALVRVEALAASGLFWSDLFIYNEETDLSIRILKAGYRILYSPKAQVYHNPSHSGRVVPGRYWFYQARNHIWIAMRYYPFPLVWVKISIYILVYIIKSTWNRHLFSCLAGIATGLHGCRFIGEFRDKLTLDQCLRIESLNRRTSLKLRR